MNPAQSAVIAEHLAPLLPQHQITANPGIGYHGILINSTGDSNITWYFDNTYGGDDPALPHLAIYRNIGEDTHDNRNPDGAPADNAPHETIARWIAHTINQEQPT